MDYVAGRNLLRYATEEGLGLQAKLGLVICDAVQNAHQQLVIHHDLKPANILVDEEGHPKLPDFGIAELMDPEQGEQGLTLTQFPVMPPECASPEQIRGEVVGTMSEVTPPSLNKLDDRFPTPTTSSGMPTPTKARSSSRPSTRSRRKTA